jgi:hypothetical protein
MIRPPAVAGQFYSASTEQLGRDVSRYLDLSVTDGPAIACVCPHAGLMYSGHVAGAVFAELAVPGRVILLGPNHWGEGPPISLFADGAWEIPGATIPVDRTLAAALLARCPAVAADPQAHRFEHCLEVQLPFLRRRRPDVRIVPVLLATADRTTCRNLGLALAAVVREAGAEPPLLLASSDLNHYEPDEPTRAKDRLAIEAILALDPDRLADVCRAHEVSMCGLAPTMTVLHAARALGAGGARLVRYATSADAGGDRRRVVGYAGILIA